MLATANAVSRLSWSQVDRYTRCPMAWWLSRRRKPEFVPSALKFGTAIHKATAAYYEAIRDGCHLGADELLQVYESAWAAPEQAKIRFGKGENESGLHNMAQRMLAAFVGSVEPGEVLAVEQSLAVGITDDILLNAVVDLLEYRDGAFIITDWKTSRGEPSTSFSGEQLLLYCDALQEVGLIPPDSEVRLAYGVLRKLKSRGEYVTVPVEVTDKALADVRQKVAQVAGAGVKSLDPMEVAPSLHGPAPLSYFAVMEEDLTALEGPLACDTSNSY